MNRFDQIQRSKKIYKPVHTISQNSSKVTEEHARTTVNRYKQLEERVAKGSH